MTPRRGQGCSALFNQSSKHQLQMPNTGLQDHGIYPKISLSLNQNGPVAELI